MVTDLFILNAVLTSADVSALRALGGRHRARLDADPLLMAAYKQTGRRLQAQERKPEPPVDPAVAEVAKLERFAVNRTVTVSDLLDYAAPLMPLAETSRPLWNAIRTQVKDKLRLRYRRVKYDERAVHDLGEMVKGSDKHEDMVRRLGLVDDFRHTYEALSAHAGAYNDRHVDDDWSDDYDENTPRGRLGSRGPSPRPAYRE